MLLHHGGWENQRPANGMFAGGNTNIQFHRLTSIAGLTDEVSAGIAIHGPPDPPSGVPRNGETA